MIQASPQSHRSLLRSLAVRAMRERGLEPDFPPEAQAQAAALDESPVAGPVAPRDLDRCCGARSTTTTPAISISSRCRGAGRRRRTSDLLAVADVDALVKKDTPVDRHAAHNTTSIYTAAKSSRCCRSGSPPISPRSMQARTACRW